MVTSAATEKLANFIDMSPVDLGGIIATAPSRYKVYSIPKRDGSPRIIAHPSRELKEIQYAINKIWLNKVPVHEAAMAYRPGYSIKANADLHRDSSFLLKMDFSNFFNSILFNDVVLALQNLENVAFTDDDCSTIAKLCCWRSRKAGQICLSVGAPTSPNLSNIVMRNFDKEVEAICATNGIIYSRYADDITLSHSSSDSLIATSKDVQSLVAAMKSPRLRFNPGKFGLYGKGRRRMVTGLVITPTGEVSLGRERKRLLSSAIHWYLTDKDTSEKHAAWIHGWISYAESVEPDFVGRLVKKYGKKIHEIK